METTISALCAELKNYFCKREDIHIGDFAISNGAITPSISMQSGQYYRIVGSVFNDGVHKSGSESLIDEGEFHGAVWLMRVPQDIISLASDVEAWKAKYADAISGPYQSESFGGYSYSKASRADGKSGADWRNQSEFAARMNPYRRIRVL